MLDSAFLTERRNHSSKLLTALEQSLAAEGDLHKHPSVTLFATGSYARGEAHAHSDIDLFFVDTANSVSRVSQLVILGSVITVCRRLGLPEFSSDGRFLHFHRMDKICEHLGGPEDDFGNSFTARLLLLLESKPVCNRSAYRHLLETTVMAYYRDYHDHEKNFRPVFLANDITRFWKTMCLNYENKRNRPSDDQHKKNENHLKNLKLKFSRLLTCFSTIVLLSRNHKIIDPGQLVAFLELTPLERLARVAESVPEGGTLTRQMIEHYSWFLESTGRSKEEVLAWLGGDEARNDAFRRARDFGQLMYDLLLRATSDGGILRYIVI